MDLYRRTVKKYSEIDGTFIHGGIGKNHKSKLDIYKEAIVSLLEDGVNNLLYMKKLKKMVMKALAL